MKKGYLGYLLISFGCLVMGVSAANAANYEFSYTFTSGERLVGVVEGDPDQVDPNRIIVSGIVSARLEFPLGAPAFEYPLNSTIEIRPRNGTLPAISFDGTGLDIEVCFCDSGTADYEFYLDEEIEYFPEPDVIPVRDMDDIEEDAQGWVRVRAEYFNEGTGSPASLNERSDPFLYLYEDESNQIVGPGSGLGNFYLEVPYEQFVDGLGPQPELFGVLVDGRVRLVNYLLPGTWSLTQVGGSGGGVGVVHPSARVESDGVDSSVDVGANSVILSNVTIAGGSSVGQNVRIRQAATIGSNVTIADNIRIGRNTQIGDNSALSVNVVIRRDSLVQSNVNIGVGARLGRETQVGSYTDVGANVRIRRQAIILDGSQARPIIVGSGVILGRESFTGSGVQIGSDSRIRSESTLGNDSAIGSNVIIRRQVNVGENAFIGDGTRIGRNTVVCPGVRIGSSARVGRNLLIQQDVDDNAFIRRSNSAPDPSDC